MDKEAWLSTLIAFDTTSCHSNLALIDYVANWLEHLRIPVTLTYDASKAKANLFATLPSSDGSLSGGVILSGHTDVVPVSGQIWESDPFVASRRDNRIYGRGACDMKGFLAVALALIPDLQAQTRQNAVHLAFSYDEEVGCLGVPLLIEDFKNHGIQPAACIVGEPTEMVPVVAHKGINSFRCRIHGHSVHSSLAPKGCNAIEHGAELICWLRSLAEKLKTSQDQQFDVPYTTLTNTMISGGIAMNTIPSDLEFVFEFRNLPIDKPEQILSAINNYIEKYLLPKMHRESASAAIQIEPLNSIPAFQTADRFEMIREAGEKTSKVSYATEAGFFQQAGIPTFVCGPGSISEAHKPNEFVSIDQLNKCEKFLRKVLR